MNTALEKLGCVVVLTMKKGGYTHSAIWHCPICRRNRATFHADFDTANAALERELLDPRCASCRRNGEVLK